MTPPPKYNPTVLDFDRNFKALWGGHWGGVFLGCKIKLPQAYILSNTTLQRHRPIHIFSLEILAGTISFGPKVPIKLLENYSFSEFSKYGTFLEAGGALINKSKPLPRGGGSNWGVVFGTSCTFFFIFGGMLYLRGAFGNEWLGNSKNMLQTIALNTPI